MMLSIAHGLRKRQVIHGHTQLLKQCVFIIVYLLGLWKTAKLVLLIVTEVLKKH